MQPSDGAGALGWTVRWTAKGDDAMLYEATTQCRYHFGTHTVCRRVQLRHRPGITEWQEPKWVCAPCRTYLAGLFRYVRPTTTKGA